MCALAAAPGIRDRVVASRAAHEVPTVEGLITTSDLHGDKQLRVVHERGLRGIAGVSAIVCWRTDGGCKGAHRGLCQPGRAPRGACSINPRISA